MIKGLSDYHKEVSAKGQLVGTWGFNANRDFTKVSPEETNVWFFEQVFNFLRSFFGLVLPDNMELITYNATKQIKKEGLEQQTFLDELMLIMKSLKEPLWTFRLNLNVIGFLRTQHDPDTMTRVQIQEPCSFIVWGGPDETGFQSFSISYHLFNEGKMEGSDEMIWSVNQPLLQKALRKWEMQTGRMIEVVDANSGRVPATKNGFRKPGMQPGAVPGGVRPQGAPPPGARPPAPGAQAPGPKAPGPQTTGQQTAGPQTAGPKKSVLPPGARPIQKQPVPR